MFSIFSSLKLLEPVIQWHCPVGDVRSGHCLPAPGAGHLARLCGAVLWWDAVLVRVFRSVRACRRSYSKDGIKSG